MLTVITSSFQGTCADGVNKIAFNVTKGKLLGKSLLIKFYFLFHFWTVSVTFSAFCGKFFSGFVKVHSFRLSIRTFMGKNFQKNCTSSIIFGSWTNLSGLLPKFFRFCRNCILRVPRNMSQKILMLWRN